MRLVNEFQTLGGLAKFLGIPEKRHPITGKVYYTHTQIFILKVLKQS